LVIAEESGSSVLAVGYQGKLYHSHIFGTASISAEEIAQYEKLLDYSKVPLHLLDEAVAEVVRTQSTLPNGIALPHETAP
jgi:hypothetical protein